MGCQYRELHLSLEDAKKLWLYAWSTVSKHHALDNALAKTKVRSKVGAEKTASIKKERDEAKEET